MINFEGEYYKKLDVSKTRIRTDSEPDGKIEYISMLWLENNNNNNNNNRWKIYHCNELKKNEIDYIFNKVITLMRSKIDSIEKDSSREKGLLGGLIFEYVPKKSKDCIAISNYHISKLEDEIFVCITRDKKNIWIIDQFDGLIKFIMDIIINPNIDSKLKRLELEYEVIQKWKKQK